MAVQVKDSYATLRGVVTPCGWDDDNTVLDICIADNTEQEYVVIADGKGKELYGHLQAFVQVAGTIVEARDGRRMIRVERYKCIKPAAGRKIYELPG